MPSPHTIRFAAIALAVVLGIAGAKPLRAQSLVEMYRSARFNAQAAAILERTGGTAAPMETVRLPYPSDSTRQEMRRYFPSLIPPEPVAVPQIEISEYEAVPKLARGWFEKKFPDVQWSYLGSNGMTTLDTTFTRELRARLEAKFGAPTQTIADLDVDVRNRDNIQFEYWFVLNDSIPFVVMDVNGPFERGVVVASGAKYRRMLPVLRDKFLASIVESRRREPYVDYYFLPEQQMWFLTGFDGARYFLKRIAKPDLRVGRPLLESVLGR